MSTPKGFTEAELEALSPEERDAIEDYEVDDDATTTTDDDTDASNDKVEGNDGDNTAEDDDAGGDDTTAGGDANDTVDGGAAGDDIVTGGDDTTDTAVIDEVEEEEPYLPTMKVNGNLDTLKADLKKIVDEKSVLTEKFQSGDITTDEYIKGNDDLTDKALDVKSAITKEETAIDFNKNQEAGHWQHVQDQFAKTEDGKAIWGNPMLLAAFDNKVRQLGSDKANDGKPGSWYLKTAAAEVKKVMTGAFPSKEKVDPKPGADNKTAGDDKTTPKPARKPNLAAVPATLGSLPAAASDDQAGGDEFAFLDKLEGSELEDELAMMERSDPNKYERYLKAA